MVPNVDKNRSVELISMYDVNVLSEYTQIAALSIRDRKNILGGRGSSEMERKFCKK